MQFDWNEKTYEIEYDFEPGDREYPDAPGYPDSYMVTSMIDDKLRECIGDFSMDELECIHEAFTEQMENYFC
jgi:hypothetical protein